MSDIDKKLVYNAYGDDNIWLIDVEDKLTELYQQGYRYITHYDKKYDTVYSIDSSGGYDLVWGAKYSTLEDDLGVIYQEDINNVHMFLEAINNTNKKVIWNYGDKYEITKGDPIYSLIFTSLPSQTTLFRFYAEVKEEV